MSSSSPTARRGLDAIALTLLGGGLALACCLGNAWGEARFVPPSSSSWHAAPSHIRYQLFDILGQGAYGFVGGWLMLAGYRFARPGWGRFGRRALGWLILVAGSTVVLEKVAPHLDGGSGGVAGAAAGQWLDQRFGPLGGAALLTLGIGIGIYLAAVEVIGAGWKAAKRTVRVFFLVLELVLLSASKLCVLAAHLLQRLALPLSRRLHPERFPAAIVTSPPLHMTAAAAPIFPIHHHLATTSPAAAKERSDSPSPLISNFKPDPTVPELRQYDLPPLDLLDEPTPLQIDNLDQKLRDVAAQLEKACADFGITVKVAGIHTGPVITQFEISLETGLRVSKITALSDDLALHLKVPSVRIVAPIPGKNTVGVEVPNEQRAVVRIKELASAGHARIAKSKLPLLLGKDSEGRPLIHDLAEMPHLLIAGRTGTGKSVCLNSIILSLLLTRRPEECKLIMIDPKQVELAEYGRLPHLMHPVVTDNKKAEAILSWAVDKMEERYEILRRSRVRNIAGYNDLPYEEILRRVKPVDEDEQKRVPPRMPYIVIVVDEVGDLMMAMKKEVEGHIIRLAQKSRAAGIHLILTTQRPTVDVITGLIKSNLPARICFQVADRSNSRVVLDEMGAEKLLGKGDMLFLQPNSSSIVRAQGAFASDDEILRIVGKLEVENPVYDSELMGLREESAAGKNGMMETIRKRDDLYEDAIEIVIREGRGSVSLLQRALGIGYGRAARLVDYMAEDGIVGSFNGGQAREVLFTTEQWNELKNGGPADLAESA